MREKPGPSVYVSARVPPDLAEAFWRLVDKNDRTFSQELRRAMRRHLDEDEKEDE